MFIYISFLRTSYNFCINLLITVIILNVSFLIIMKN